MPRGRKKAGKPEAGASGNPGQDIIDTHAVTLAYSCGLVGCNKLETEDKLKKPLTDKRLIESWSDGKAQHAFTVMSAIYEKALAGSEKLLIWLAENNLKRSVDTQTGDAVIDAMTPEQRRDEIRKLTKKLAINE
jgi:hypothetical protein